MFSRYEFATRHDDGEGLLSIDVHLSPGTAPQPPLTVSTPGWTIRNASEIAPGTWRLSLAIPPAPPGSPDDEVTSLVVAAGSAPLAEVVLRRTNCKISTTLLEGAEGATGLGPQTRAALLWFGWNRFRELCALKRFGTGKSDSDVVVFRPRLRGADTAMSSLQHGNLHGITEQAWGSCLLVKTGSRQAIEEEWHRYHLFLADRAHPFMARSEAFLTAQAPQPSQQKIPQATLIGSFLGGELLQVESFESLVRGAPDSQPCLRVLEKLFAMTATWYSGSAVQPLGAWAKVFRRSRHEAFLPAAYGNSQRNADPGECCDVTWPPADVPLALFGKFDLTDDDHRRRFYAGVDWDTSFITSRHLTAHLLGKQRDGLLYRLMSIPVRFSLTHGDLHTRNILADRDNVWLIDFSETGAAPTLFDFAKLEIYLRLWCLNLSPQARDADDLATRLETLLLDHLTGSEAGLAAVLELAPDLGAEPTQLLKIAQCICWIRRRALEFTLGTPDQRDYLAVLYLTALHALTYAADHKHLTQNYRWLLGLCWVLEDVLSRIVGLEPFERHRTTFDRRYLIDRDWLTAPGAAQRLRYFLDRPDGRLALAPLAATRGVLQNRAHHLDVFDHTLCVLTYIEELIADPLAGLLDPPALDRKVDYSLRRQHFVLPPPSSGCEHARPDVEALRGMLDQVAALLTSCLEPQACLALKWAAVFHDVGKPATRSARLATNAETRVQFLGHEVYSLDLAAEYLLHLFPDPDGKQLRERVGRLILRHLEPLQLFNRYLDEMPAIYPELKSAATTGRPARELNFLTKFWDEHADKYMPDFPLLLLHGFADASSTRGHDQGRRLGETAEIILVLLCLYLQYPGNRQNDAQRNDFKILSRGLGKELGLDGPALGKVLRTLEAWYQTEVARRQAAGLETVTRDELLARAGQHDGTFP